jgi:hypothetical protein
MAGQLTYLHADSRARRRRQAEGAGHQTDRDSRQDRLFEHVDMLPSVQTEQSGENRQKNGNHGRGKRQISVIMQLAKP